MTYRRDQEPGGWGAARWTYYLGWPERVGIGLVGVNSGWLHVGTMVGVYETGIVGAGRSRGFARCYSETGQRGCCTAAVVASTVADTVLAADAGLGQTQAGRIRQMLEASTSHSAALACQVELRRASGQHPPSPPGRNYQE